jgi:hypothetical protein
MLDTGGCTNTRFANNVDGSGTITDNETGLIWERKVAWAHSLFLPMGRIS